MRNARENRTRLFDRTRTFHEPGCEAGANPAMGSCVVRQSSAALGSSGYSAVLTVAPDGSSHSTRNWSLEWTCRATNQRKAWRWVEGNVSTSCGTVQDCSLTEAATRLWVTVIARTQGIVARMPSRRKNRKRTYLLIGNSQ